jgi:nucleoside-diphosphate-sugar epimerase
MNILITGAAGFLGKKLTNALLDRGYLTDGEGNRTEITSLTLCDIAEPAGLPADNRIQVKTGDISDSSYVKTLIQPGTRGIFHLAAIVSADAEENFDLGMRVNLDGTRNILEACRAADNRIRLVFASSCAVYGGNLPGLIEDDFHLTPQSSYGIQKAASELLVQDYSRKGFISGLSLRLPTVVIRPGKPNKAASTFASSILRDTLQGNTAVCPVGKEARMFIASPRRIIASFIHGFEIPPAEVGPVTSVMLPGISVTVGDMVDSLKKFGGQEAVDRIEWKPNERIKTLVQGWPGNFNTLRAQTLGFTGDTGMDAIVKAFLEDDIER